MHNIITSDSDVSKRISRHPCFFNYDYHNTIIHLPVALESNINCNYDIYSSSIDKIETVLSPYEAMERYHKMKKRIPNLNVVAIAGPGEPLANFDVVKDTLRFIRQSNPEILLCLSTNGLMLPVYANHLISLGVNYITITLYTINPDNGAKIYNSITYLGHKYYGVEGANILLQNQISGINFLVSRGVSVRINIVAIKGINDHEIIDIAHMAKDIGCKMTNIIPFVSSHGATYEKTEAFRLEELEDLRRECDKIIPQSYYCKACGAATVETLNSKLAIDFKDIYESVQGEDEKIKNVTYRFAVCSTNGELIDQHFGQATKFYIYDYMDGEITLIEIRSTEPYRKGTKEEKADGRIYKLIKTIEDCNCVVCLRIGICPSDALKEKDIDVYTTYNLLEAGLREAVLQIYTSPSFNK